LTSLGKKIFNEYIFVSNIPHRIIPEAVLREKNYYWFDDKRTLKVETPEEIFRKSLSQALTELENDYGHDILNWSWGELHKLTIKHYLHSKIKLLNNFLDLGPFEIGGDGTTIANSEYLLTSPFEAKLGASMRFIYDFSDPNAIYVILPTGQSGNPFSKHYKDMTSLWLKGRYVKINTDEELIKKGNLQQTLILP